MVYSSKYRLFIVKKTHTYLKKHPEEQPGKLPEELLNRQPGKTAASTV